VAVLTYKIRSTSTPVYLNDRITERVCSRTLRSSANAIPLLDQPFTRTDFSRRAFRFSAPSVCLELAATNSSDQRLSVFKCRLQTFFYSLRLSGRPATSAFKVTTVWRYI